MLVVIGILAAMVVPSYGKMMELARVRDARSTLNLIYQAERLYRLDNGTYTSLRTGDNSLTVTGYLSDPDAGVAPGSNPNWNFNVLLGFNATTFTAQATRTGGEFTNRIITVDQNFTGRTQDYGPPEPDSTGLGHPMRHR